MKRLGLVDYGQAQELQKRLVQQRKRDKIEDQLLLVEHPPVITLGKSDDRQLLRVPESHLGSIELVDSGRGGKITYHGPGQLVAYPILALHPEERDLHRHLRRLEEVVIGLAQDFGLAPTRVPGRTGVWVGREKLAAVGVRASSWVTSHGVAVNVADRLEGFDLIVPCGLTDAGVTCLERLLGQEPERQEVERLFCKHFETVFKRRLVG